MATTMRPGTDGSGILINRSGPSAPRAAAAPQTPYSAVIGGNPATGTGGPGSPINHIDQRNGTGDTSGAKATRTDVTVNRVGGGSNW